MQRPIGIDCPAPRFAWKLRGAERGLKQTAYRLVLAAGDAVAADTGRVESDASIEVVVPGWTPAPMTEYEAEVTVWDNMGRSASLTDLFETGRLGVPFHSGWVEPEQEPTPASMDGARSGDTIAADDLPRDAEGRRTFAEFRPAQYVRIPFTLEANAVRARVYTAKKYGRSKI